MASVQLNSYDGRTARLTVIEESYSINDNTSTIKWTLESVGGSVNYYNMYNIEAIVNGSTVYGPTTKSWSAKSFPAAKGSTSGTISITHDDDGSHADITFTVKGRVYNSGTETHNGALPLTTIPRASIINSVSGGSTLNGISVNITKYSSSFTNTLTISRGSTTITRSEFNGGGISFSEAERLSIFNNQSYNATQSWSITLKTYNGSTQIGSTQTSSVNITTENICTITSLPSLNVESSMPMSTSRPCGGTFEVYAYLNSNRSDNNCYSSGSQSSAWSSKSITPTASTIYSYNGSSQSGTLYWRIITKINGSQVGYKDYASTYYFVQSLCGPSISNLQYCFVSNTAATIMGLTVNTWYNYNSGTGLNKLIAGKAQIKLKVSGSAQTGKGASLSKVYVTIPGQANKESATSGAELTPNSPLSANGQIFGYVVDSRGFSVGLSFSYTLKPYNYPVVNDFSVVRNPMSSTSSSDQYVRCSISATAPDYIVNATSTKHFTIYYQWKESSASSWSDSNSYDCSSMVTRSGENITLTDTQLSQSFTTNKQYDFRIRIVDELGADVYSTVKVIPISAPLIAKRPKRVGINCIPKNMVGDNQAALDVYGPAYISGSSIIGGYLQVSGVITSHTKQLMSYFDIDLRTSSINNFYPITFTPGVDLLDCEIHSPARNGGEAYNQNVIHFRLLSTGWSDTPRVINVLEYHNYDDSEITIGCIGCGTSSSYEHCVWLRGGTQYRMYSNFTPNVHTSNYTGAGSSPSTYTVGTSYQGGSNTNVAIMFTPQSTIVNGMYTSDNFKVNGTFTANTLSVVNRLYYGSGGAQDYHEAGFIHDQYGNWQHRRNTAGDNWSISSYSNGAKLIFYPETGHLDLKGDVTYYSKRMGSSNANINTSGSNYYSTGCSNVPTDWVFVNTYHDESSDGFQIACSVVQNCLYTRIKNSGNWSSWSKIPQFSYGTGDPSGGYSGDVYFKYS